MTDPRGGRPHPLASLRRQLSTTLATPVTAVARSVVDLAAPRSCASCDAAGPASCAGCLSPLLAVPHDHRPRPAPAGLPRTMVIADYSGSVRDLLTAWKERGHRSLAPMLAEALASAIRSGPVSSAIAMALADGGSGSGRGSGRGSGSGVVSLVPVPASTASRARRGEDIWRRVVTMAARDASSGGIRLVVDPCLVLTRQPRDQAGLASAERSSNLDGAMACRRPPASPVLVLDDVITTGATVVESTRALREAGVDPVLALALAGTPRRGTSRRPEGR